MRPTPRILLLEHHLSPSPLVSAAPTSPPPPCLTHACRWWPYSGSKEFEANAAMVLIILLSALICALALNSAIRCFFRVTHIADEDRYRHRNSNNNNDDNSHDQLANNQMQVMKTVNAAPCGGPTVVYTAEMKAELSGEAAECAICLSEFVDGEGIRVLERCKHGFHSHCIQAWISASHSSCPTCRRTCLPPPQLPIVVVEQPPLPESSVP